jgi:hypothetical protein
MLGISTQGRAVLAVLAVLIGLVAAGPAWAQTTGALRVGTVDDTGLPIPGVTLLLTGESLIGGTQERTSDAEGAALFVQLPAGRYRLSAQKAGFTGVTIENLQVSIGREVRQQVVLEPGAAEEIIVEAKEKAVDVSSTSRSTILTKEFLQKVPAGRTYQEAVNMAAGVTGAQGGNPNMGGSASDENTYMLDGANITDPVTGTFSLNFNFDAIQQIEVILGGYMPEHGTSVGGIINIVTESGTNNLQFDSSIYYNNGNFAPHRDARLTTDNVPLAPTGFDSEFQGMSVNSKISGPLIRDKAWFVVSYSNDRTWIANVGIPQARTYDGHYILGKLTYQPSTEHRLSMFIQSNPTVIDNDDQFDPLTRPEAQSRQAQGGYVASGKWQWFLSPDVNLDTTLTVQKIFIEVNGVPCTHDLDSDFHPCNPLEEEGYVDWQTPGRLGAFGAYNSVNFIQFYFDDRLRYEANSDLSLVAIEDPLGGTHDLKFGIEGSQLVWDQISGFTGNQQFVDRNIAPFDPTTFTNYYWFETSGPIKFRTTSAAYAAFAQDSWKPVSNLTLNYGLRFDSFVARNDLGEPVISGALVGPRLFGAWDPWGDQRTKIATGYGRFNDTSRLAVAAFTSANSFGSKLFLGEYFDDSTGGGFLNSQNDMFLTNIGENLNESWENTRTPSVDEVLLTLEREVVEDVALFSTMSGKFTRHMYEYDDRNLVWDSDGSAIIGSRFGGTLQFYPRLRTPTLAKRDYFQWDIGVRKVLSRRWQAGATYTYAQSYGSSNSALSGSFRIDPQTQYNYGPLLTDLRHQFKAAGFWDLPTDPWTATIGFFFEYFEGYPDDRLYYSESFDSYTVRVRPRGTYLRFNGWWDLRLQYQQDFDVKKGALSTIIIADNIFNNQAPMFPYGSEIDSQNRLLTAVRQSPLRLTVGVSYEF